MPSAPPPPTASHPAKKSPRLSSRAVPAADAESSEATADESHTPSQAAPPKPWHDRPAVLSVATGLLLFGSFFPLDWGPLAWVALVPLLRLALLDDVSRRYRWAYLAGLVWTVPQLQWMRLGDPMMYLAWASLALYVAAYLPAMVGLVRVGCVRLALPLPLVAGVAWTALELVRAHLFTGFAWYLLGHSQHRLTPLVQIADLGGAYAISLLIASFAGLVVMAWRASDRGQPMRGPILATAVWMTLLAGSLGYGLWRIATADFRPGPRVALVQGNFPSSLKSDPTEHQRSYALHRTLTGEATRLDPDLILWPETMLPYPVFAADESIPPSRRATLAPQVDPLAWDRGATEEAIRDLAAMSGADLLLGGTVIALDESGLKQFNAALPVTAADGLGEHYAKLHRVPFGEYVPGTDWSDGLAGWAASLGLPSIAAGERPMTIELAGATLLPLICFEDTVPHLVRRVARQADRAGQKPDLIANLTNDGWFHGSSELDQHLTTAQFRSVELRLPTVRAVNTGISAIIDGCGRIVQPETIIDLDGLPDGSARTGMLDAAGTYHRQFAGVLVGTVPLDGRGTLYGLFGDWLAGGCLLLVVVSLAIAWRLRPGERGA